MLPYLVGSPRRIGFASLAPTGQAAIRRDALLTDTYHSESGLHEPKRFSLLLPERVCLTADGRSNTGGELIKSLQESDMSIILLARRGDLGIAEHLHSFTGGSTTLVAVITTFVESSH